MRLSTKAGERYQGCQCGVLFDTTNWKFKLCSLCKGWERMIKATTSYQCLHDTSELLAYKNSYLSTIQMNEMLKFAYLPTGGAWRRNGVTYIVRGRQNSTDYPPEVPQWLDTKDAEMYIDAISKNGQEPEEDSAASTRFGLRGEADTHGEGGLPGSDRAQSKERTAADD